VRRRRPGRSGSLVAGLSAMLVLMAAGESRAQGVRGQADNQVHIETAATRFGLSPRLVAELIRVESGGDPRAVSSKGAMGLMQLMPTTWRMLRARLDLGDDPFDPRDNILAGTAYLRELHDRYGAPGFLAAYNAGPGRYEASLTGRPLPAETQAYLARLSQASATPAGLAPSLASPWTRAGLFASPWPLVLGEVGGQGGGDPAAGATAPLEGPIARGGRLGGSLFVPRSRAAGRP